jgi:phosphoribosyl 1,2-cyclic phosphodiesterase
VQPFPVPHDAREPVQYILADGGARLAVLTDAGHVTTHMVAMLDRSDAIVLECNHDLAMLEKGAYPLHLKRRIAGSLGHLDNAAAGVSAGENRPVTLATCRCRAHLGTEQYA